MASVLQITPHAVFPPRGGRRAFFFLREMAREHQVVAILPQTLDSLRGTREGYRFPANVDVRSPLDTPPPRTLFDGLPSRLRSALKYRWLRRSWRGFWQTFNLRNLRQALRVHPEATGNVRHVLAKTRRLLARGKPTPHVITAVARELVGFIWAIGVTVEREQTMAA